MHPTSIHNPEGAASETTAAFSTSGDQMDEAEKAREYFAQPHIKWAMLMTVLFGLLFVAKYLRGGNEVNEVSAIYDTNLTAHTMQAVYVTFIAAMHVVVSGLNEKWSPNGRRLLNGFWLRRFYVFPAILTFGPMTLFSFKAVSEGYSQNPYPLDGWIKTSELGTILAGLSLFFMFLLSMAAFHRRNVQRRIIPS